MDQCFRECNGWTIGRLIGRGMCGEVREATRKEKEKKFALKIVNFSALVDQFRDIRITADTLEVNLMREIEVMKMIRHRNVIHLEEAFWDKGDLFICMEMVEGSDLLKMVPPGGMDEETAKPLFFQLCSAVSFCHSKNVIHGDLKPENILVRAKDNRLKLIDFGFSHIVRPNEHLEILGGTVLYSPPDDSEMTFAFDDWACGVILYAMLTCTLPFSAAILRSRKDLILKVPSKISDGALEILAGLLNPERDDRVSVATVLASADWLATERGKELPETLTTLALAHQMSKPRVEVTHTLPIARKCSEFPLEEHRNDLKIWGQFLQKIKNMSKSKSKGEVSRRSPPQSAENSKDSLFSPPPTASSKIPNVTPQKHGSLLSLPPVEFVQVGHNSPSEMSPHSLSSQTPRDSPLGNCDASPDPFAQSTRSMSNKDANSSLGTPRSKGGSLSGGNEESENLQNPRDTFRRSPLAGPSVRPREKGMFSRNKSSLGTTPAHDSSSPSSASSHDDRSPPKHSMKKQSLLNQLKKFPPPSFLASRKDISSNLSDNPFAPHRSRSAELAPSEVEEFFACKPKADEMEHAKVGRRRSNSLEPFNIPDQPIESHHSVTVSVELVMVHLKIFGKSQKKYMENLNRLIEFQCKISKDSELSSSESSWIIPDSLREIRCLHQTISVTLQSFVENSLQLSISFTDIGCTLEAVFSMMTSERVQSSYLAYSKDFIRSTQILHCLKNRNFDFSRFGMEYEDLSESLLLPLSNVRGFCLEMAGIVMHLDGHAKKQFFVTSKTLESLARKCFTNVLMKV